MSERKPRLEWKRVEIDANEYQWRAKVGELFDLFVDEPTDDDSAEWSVHGSDLEWASDDATDIEAGKLAAEDYAFAELVKAVASFGASIVDKGERSK